jgi:phenylpropionate dioxygenase-like ring-hydroxylating dioxygenase large terminal subunit
MISDEVESQIAELVDYENGLVATQIFQDEQIYQLELERIFARCWLYLAHESQLKHHGDYVTAQMGEDPVVVVRNSDGELRAFLNSCTHRGAKVCRADQGNSRALRCPYHGWTFSLSGQLQGVPRHKTAYFNELDRSKLGLFEVAKLDTYNGLIFATWDPEAPSLREYLGDFTTYLDLMLARSEGGVEVIGGVHKWTIETNWKIPAENFCGDQYHLSTTHGSSVEVGLRKRVTDFGHTIHVANGHGLVREKGGAQQGTAALTEYTKYIEQVQRRINEEKGDQAAEFVPIGVGTIFPNLSFMDSVRFRTLRIWQPRGPRNIEVDSWCLVDTELPDELKEAAMRQYILSFGPSGMFEQDDGEIWTSISEATRGFIGRQRGKFNYQMGLGHEIPVREAYGIDMPGRVGEAFMTEANQRSYYRRWKQLMNGVVT